MVLSSVSQCSMRGSAAARRRPTRRRSRRARSAGSAGCAAAGRASRPGRRRPRPTARAWTRTLPSAAASTGPASTGRPQASAVSWHSSSLRAPPPTRCTTSTCRPDSSLRLADGAPVGQRQAVQDAPDRLGRRLRHGLPGPPAGVGDPGGHVARAAGRPGRRGRRRRRSAGTARRLAQQRSSGTATPSSAQVRRRLLQQPQAHDVAQVADGAVDAQLVGEVGRAGWPRSAPARRARPRPATRCRRRCRRSAPLRRARRRRPTRCRASRRRHTGTGRQPGDVRHLGAAAARPRSPGSRSGGKQADGRARARSIRSGRPGRVRTSSSPVVEALVSSAPTRAGQPVADQVGDQQQRCGAAAARPCPVPRRAGRSC